MRAADEMSAHSAEGERICLSLRSVVHHLPIIRDHHEGVDGAGYPDQLLEEALRRLRASSGKQWDAHLLETFIHLRDGGLAECIADARLVATA